MFSLEIRAPQERHELLIAELWEHGCSGITELEGGLRAYFEEDSRAPEMLRRFDRFGAVARHEEERDWVAVSRSIWEPVPVGERFYLVPEWRDDPAPAGRLRIPINPGLACGSGLHEATRLCLEALERHVSGGASVLDVGVGAGVLSLAAALLGAGRVTGCDTDPEAIAVARSRLAGHSPSAMLFLGSADAVRSGVCDVVAVNISAAAAMALAPELCRCARRGGILLVSGFERHESAAVRAAFEARGAALHAARENSGWTLLEMWRRIDFS